jgi:hypothetical protein
MISENDAIDMVKDMIKTFDWHNYRLDLVEQTESDDWADELATEIVQRISQHGRETENG